jgi:hypothetical protein
MAAYGTHSLVNVSDLTTMARLGPSQAGHEGPVSSIAIGTPEDQTALAAGDKAGTAGCGI